jgi:hypothetical protein
MPIEVCVVNPVYFYNYVFFYFKGYKFGKKYDNYIFEIAESASEHYI